MCNGAQVSHSQPPTTCALQMASVGSLRWLNISQNRLQQFPPVLLGAARLEELTLSAGPVAGTPVAAFGGLHVQLPRLRLLKVGAMEAGAGGCPHAWRGWGWVC